MELRHLRYFVAVAEELSFTRAARKLHIAQPPLSQQVRALEEELGARLLDRTHHRVELTAAGTQFLNDARIILAQAEEAVQKAQRTARGEEGTLRLGFVTTAMYEDTVPRLIRDFQNRYPAVALRLEQLSSVEQVQALLGKALDAGFIRTPIDEPRLVLRTITRESLVLALPAGHRLAQLARVQLRSLASERWVVTSRDKTAGFYQKTLELCERAGFKPNVAVEVGEIPTAVGLVAAGFGVSLVPAAATRSRHRSVVYVPLASPHATSEVCLAYLRDSTSPVLSHFVKLIGRSDPKNLKH
jgi:DNA-binding transcriptional LysR family regulator